jgi:hypothetical protein
MSENDRIFTGFLERQMKEGSELDAASDIVDLLPLETPGDGPPQRYIADLHCRGLVQTEDNEIQEWNDFSVGIYFPAGYLRSADPFIVLTWLGPPSVKHPNLFTYHPNIAMKAPLICVGPIAPGMPLVDLVHQTYEIVSYQKFTPNELDSLNKSACSWARSNGHRFPLDNRPLKRRTLNLDVE